MLLLKKIFLKKMYLKKKLVFGICLLFILSSVAACSKSSESASSSSDNSSQNSSAQASNIVYGKVTKVDGNKITLALGDMAQGNMGAAPSGMPQGGGQDGKNGGQAPSGAPDKNGKSDGSAPNGGQDGKSGGQAPSGAPGKGSGQAPSGMPQGGQPGNMGGGFTENGETKEITIDDESLIKVQSGNTQTQGSLDDITVDSILTVEYSDSNTISAILVHSNGQGAKPDSKSDSSSDSTK